MPRRRLLRLCMLAKELQRDCSCPGSSQNQHRIEHRQKASDEVSGLLDHIHQSTSWSASFDAHPGQFVARTSTIHTSVGRCPALRTCGPERTETIRLDGSAWVCLAHIEHGTDVFRYCWWYWCWCARRQRCGSIRYQTHADPFHPLYREKKHPILPFGYAPVSHIHHAHVGQGAVL